MKSPSPHGPPERHRTIRQQMEEVLRQQSLNLRDLSQFLGIGEKEAADHLDHLARAHGGGHGNLQVTPSRCLDCDFVFVERKRLSKPGRCPRCKGSHLTAPLYRIT